MVIAMLPLERYWTSLSTLLLAVRAFSTLNTPSSYLLGLGWCVAQSRTGCVEATSSKAQVIDGQSPVGPRS